MKNTQKTSTFKYYYKELLSHYGITPQNKYAINFFKRISIINIALLIVCCLFFIFRDSSFVRYFTSGSIIMYYLYAFMLLYAFTALASYTIYHIISYRYEIKNKHELQKKDIKGVYTAFLFIYKFIHLPWILLTCLVLKLLALFRIANLKKYLPLLICGYSYFLIVAFTILLTLLKLTYKILTSYTFLTNNYVTETTYLYLIVFISIVISKHVPTVFLKIIIHPFVIKNSSEYKKIFDQYHLLNYYFLVAITLILKALNFTDDEKILIDALFYTTNALTLFSTAFQKAKNTL